MRRGVAALLLLVVWLPAAAANGQPVPPGSGSDPGVTSDSKKEEAKRRFERGLAMMSEEAWDIALAEFLRSREIYATRSATKNAAICLRKLRRFDDSLDMFEALIKEFPTLPREDQAFAEHSMIELRAVVGFINVRGAAAGAVITIDGRNRGVARAETPIRVSAGTRFLRVEKAGLVPFEKRVEVPGEQTVAVDIHMTSLAQPALPTGPESGRGLPQSGAESGRRFVVELDGGAVLAPSFGGSVVDGCADPCSSSVGVGLVGQLHLAYQVGSGFSFGVSAGGLTVAQSTMGRVSEIVPMGRPANVGLVDDVLRLSGVLLGASAAWRTANQFPITFRLGTGALLGSLDDVRTGAFQSSLGTPYSVELVDSVAARYFYLSPELRLGVRFADRFEISLGMQAVALIAITKPTADAEKSRELTVPDDGRANFRFGQGEDFTAGAMIFMVPSLGLRADL